MFIDTEVPPDHRLRATLADFRAAHPVATVHLQGLIERGVEELVQGWPNAPADLVPQLCRLTDGNPLFLDELLRQARLPGSRADARRATRPCHPA